LILLRFKKCIDSATKNSLEKKQDRGLRNSFEILFLVKFGSDSISRKENPYPAIVPLILKKGFIKKSLQEVFLQFVVFLSKFNQFKNEQTISDGRNAGIVGSRMAQPSCNGTE
jgi:hypothetical protein